MLLPVSPPLHRAQTAVINLFSAVISISRWAMRFVRLGCFGGLFSQYGFDNHEREYCEQQNKSCRSNQISNAHIHDYTNNRSANDFKEGLFETHSKCFEGATC